MKKLLLVLTLFIINFQKIWAQVPPPPSEYQENAGGPGGGNIKPVPVDHYLFVLIGIALLIGVYFVWNRRRVLN